MKNKKFIVFISILVIFCVGFSFVAYGGDFDLPIISTDGKIDNGSSEDNSGSGDGFTTPMIDGDEKTTSTTKKQTTTKAAPRKTTVKKPAATKITKLTRAKGALTVKYKKVKGINGYQIQIATNSKFTKNKKKANVKKASTVTKKFTKLKRNKKYYVRVRTYKVVKGKAVYSKWSPVKTIKTK